MLFNTLAIAKKQKGGVIIVSSTLSLVSAKDKSTAERTALDEIQVGFPASAGYYAYEIDSCSLDVNATKVLIERDAKNEQVWQAEREQER